MILHNRNGISSATSSGQRYHIRSGSRGERIGKKGFWALLLAAVVAVSLVAAACGGKASPSPTATPAGPLTAGQMADQGKGVFSTNCARCHGDQGQGSPAAPAIIGNGAGLAKYSTAKGLYDYVSKAMPLDGPGTLSQQQYQQVLAYLLVQNNLYSRSQTMDTGKLDSISLSK